MSLNNENPFEKYFESINAEFILMNQQLAKLITHPVAIGTENESLLRTFIKNYIPKHYSVGHGFIFKGVDNISRQCDIIIYDSSFFPPLFKRDDFVVLVPESVMTVIEVKTNITKGKNSLGSAVENIKSVRKLNPRISGLIFGYNGSSAVNILNALAEYNKLHGMKLEEIFELLIVLDKDYCINPKSSDDKEVLFNLDCAKLNKYPEFILSTQKTHERSFYLFFYYVLRQIRVYIYNSFINTGLSTSVFADDFSFVPLTLSSGINIKGYFDNNEKEIKKLSGCKKYNDQGKFVGISLNNSISE